MNRYIRLSSDDTSARISYGQFGMKSVVLALLLSLTLAGTVMAQQSSQTPESLWSVPSDSDIRQILVDRIDAQKQSVGLVVGVIDPRGERVISYGALNQGDARPLGGDTE